MDTGSEYTRLHFIQKQMAYLIHPTCQIPGLADIYEKVFGPDFVGTFVEVGAFDGMTYSNTWGLAENWKGLYVEAHPDFARQCISVHRHHPKIWVESCACGASEGKIDLTVYGECSTTVLSRWNRDWGMNDNTPKITVPMFTLETLLFMHKIGQFDLLVIDVEEAEIEVLKGFNIYEHRPKMVIIELHEGQGTGQDQKGWQTPWVDNYMKGYEKIYIDNINTIYALRPE